MHIIRIGLHSISTEQIGRMRESPCGTPISIRYNSLCIFRHSSSSTGYNSNKPAPSCTSPSGESACYSDNILCTPTIRHSYEKREPSSKTRRKRYASCPLLEPYIQSNTAVSYTYPSASTRHPRRMKVEREFSFNETPLLGERGVPFLYQGLMGM